MINSLDGRPIERQPLVNIAMTNLFEDWADGAIDAGVWGQLVVGGGGIIAAPFPARGNIIVVLVCTIAGADRAQIYSQDRWENGAASFDVTSGIQYMVLDFEAMFDDVSSIEDGTTFLGLSSAQNSTRASNNIIGFGINVANAESITDNAGAETTNVAVALVDDAWHNYRIQIFNGQVIFSVDHAVTAIHTTNLPSTPMYINFNNENDVATGSLCYLANITAGYRRYPDQILV